MNQIIHIFGKDIRHLWPRVLVLWLLMMAHAVFDVRSLPGQIPQTASVSAIAGLLVVLLPLGISLIIGWAIFEEVLPGERQFWLTRPYDWCGLLAAKILFILAFINAPLFLSDCYILGVQGFPIRAVFPQLILRQAIMTVLFILPSFCIASITTGLSQFFVAWAILLLVPLFELIAMSNTHLNMVPSGSGEIVLAALAVTTCGVILWQYAVRRAPEARLMLLVLTSLYLPILWGIGYLRPSGLTGVKSPQPRSQSSVQVAYDPERSNGAQTGGTAPPNGFLLVQIPLRVTGLPPLTLLRGNGRLVLRPNATNWTFFGSLDRLQNEYSLNINLPTAVSRLIQGSVNLSSTLDLEIVGDQVETEMPVENRRYFVSGVGLCQSIRRGPENFLTCRTGLGPTLETVVRVDTDENPGRVIVTYMPNGTPWGLSPTTDIGSASFTFEQANVRYAFIPRRSVAKFQQKFEVNDLQLSRYLR